MRNKQVKGERSFSHAKELNDLYNYLIILVTKKLDDIIIHIGKNDTA